MSVAMKGGWSIVAVVACVSVVATETAYASRSMAAPRISSIRSTPLGSSPQMRRRPVLSRELWDEFNDNIIVSEDFTAGRQQSRSRGSENEVHLCSALSRTLLRGAALRIASDLSGGTPLESVKCRVSATTDTPFQAFRHIVREGGFFNLWAGTPSRTVEGALMGALFLVGSTGVKKQVLALGGGKNLAALAGGLVGGIMQAVVMTPSGMIFTTLNLSKGRDGCENDNVFTVTRRIVQQNGPQGLFVGGGAMASRQASNWASRSVFTEIARTNLRMSEFGLLGEIGSGIVGGLGSCWNTPIETIRVNIHADAGADRPPKSFAQYWNQIIEEHGVTGLFRGVSPRAMQAIWQTVFMVVVPNVLGI